MGVVGWEAIQHFAHPASVAGTTVIWVAAVGIAVNAATAWLFLSGQKGDLNIRGAFLHMAADAVVSLGVVLAGLVILLTGWQWLDPAVSLAIVAVILVGTWGLLGESVDLLSTRFPEASPPPRFRATWLASRASVKCTISTFGQ